MEKLNERSTVYIDNLYTHPLLLNALWRDLQCVASGTWRYLSSIWVLHLTFRSNFRVPTLLKETELLKTGEESERRQQMRVVAKHLDSPTVGKFTEERYMLGIVYCHCSSLYSLTGFKLQGTSKPFYFLTSSGSTGVQVVAGRKEVLD